MTSLFEKKAPCGFGTGYGCCCTCTQLAKVKNDEVDPVTKHFEDAGFACMYFYNVEKGPVVLVDQHGFCEGYVAKEDETNKGNSN